MLYYEIAFHNKPNIKAENHQGAVSSISFISSSSGYHYKSGTNAYAQWLHRAFRFYPAAHQPHTPIQQIPAIAPQNY